MADRVSRRGKSSLAGVAERVIAGVAGMVELEDISMVVLEFVEAIVTTGTRPRRGASSGNG